MAGRATDDERAEFWSWWVESLDALTTDVSEEPSPDAPGLMSRLLRRFRGDPGRGVDAAVADVDDALRDLHPGLACGFTDRWFLTGLGDRDAFAEAAALIRVCPRHVVERPELGAPQQRLDVVTAGGFTVHRRDLRFALVLRDQGLILGVVDPTGGDGEVDPEVVRRAVGRFVVSELGERTALRLAEWRVIPADSRSAETARPFDELRPRVAEQLDGTGYAHLGSEGDL